LGEPDRDHHDQRDHVQHDADQRLACLVLGDQVAHGLERDVPQAEGMAMGPDGTLYLVSEPNLFYVFRKPAR
ncbi:MAG: SdiA-regulated domain-containing protein, partial [Gammaproteobacteria bacterium]